MEQARQQALEMRDELILGFQKIKNNFPANFPGDFPKLSKSGSTTSSWRTDRQGKEWLQKVDDFFDYILTEIEDTNTSLDEIHDEVFIILRTVDKNGEPATIDIATCSKEAFVIHMVRYCIKDANIQMQYSPNWKHFGAKYSKYVMDTIPNVNTIGGENA